MKIKIALLSTILIACTLASFAQQTQTQESSSALLKIIQEEYWQELLKDNMYLRLKYGLPIGRLPDLTFKKAKADAEFARSILEKLKEVKPENLNHQELLSLRALHWENARTAEALPYFSLISSLTPYASPFPTIRRVFTEYQFKEERDLERYIGLLTQMPGVIEAAQTNTEEQFKLGIVLPKEELQLVIPFVKSMNQEADKSFLYVSADRIKGVSKTPEEYQTRVRDLIAQKINPAFKKLSGFLESEYQQKAPENVGLSQYPLGKDFYKFLVRYYTSMNVTPEEVHKIGLEEMAKIDAEMQKIRDELGFKGTKAEFHKTLKTDPKFFPKSAEQIGEILMSYVKRIEPEISKYFITLPKAPYGVKRLDPSLEASMTFGYYNTPTPQDPKGYYFYNGSNLKERSTLQAASLIYHELVPGHHFQMNLQSENKELPDFRRENMPAAFVEGWAEYSSDLAGEMGMYRDPYEKYGRLLGKAFLTSRLVVDTGMNGLGWPRSKAMDYMRENTVLSETEINTETLRYSCDIPGQALAYKMGSNKIMSLREKARSEMKDRFDIRKFHDAVLLSGALPMQILEEHVDWFISTTTK